MVTGELLLVGSCSGVFYALDKRTGQPSWSYDTGLDGEPAEFHGDPGLAGARVITGCDRTTLSHTYAFLRDSGELLWKQPRAALESDIVLVENLAIGRRWNGDLVALDVEDGAVRWTVPPTDYTYRFEADRSPIEHDGIVYFGGVDGCVYAVHAESGAVAWRRDLEDAVTTSPVTDGENVYVGVAGNRMLRLSVEEGEVTASLDLSGRPYGRPALSEGSVICMLGGSELAAIDRDLEAVRWRHTAEGTSWTSDQPLPWNDFVVVGTRDGQVIGFRARDGETVFSAAVDGVVRGLGADERALYVGTLGGTLYALEWP